jgi:hypothetical protein
MPALADVTININGTFEKRAPPANLDTIFTGGKIGTAGMPQWTVIDGGPIGDPDQNGSVDWIGTPWNQRTAVPGNTVDLDGVTPGGIEQTVSTIAGDSYLLSFYLTATPKGAPSSEAILASAGATQSIFNYTVPPGSRPNLTWVQDSIAFTATGDSTTLSFISLDSIGPRGPGSGPILGGVSLTELSQALDPRPQGITAVPEAGFYGYASFLLCLVALASLASGRQTQKGR